MAMEILMSKKLYFLKTFGGKGRLSKWIHSHLPKDYENMIFGEHFCGGSNLTLYKKPSKVEFLNDLNPNLMSIYFDMQRNWTSFHNGLMLQYHIDTFEIAKQGGLNPPSVNTFVISRMSRAGLGKDFAWSERKRGGRPGDANAWFNCLENLHLVRNRLDNAQLSCGPAIQSIVKWDSHNTIHYCDCPYYHPTRVTKDAYGQFEMDENSHVELARLLNVVNGRVILSGYNSKLYDDLYPSNKWRKVEKNVANNASQAKKKIRKVECLWLSY
jgi:DNA adenine methylase